LCGYIWHNGKDSWTHEMISDSEISIPGYMIFRRDRVRGERRRGGGVIMYVRKGLSVIDVSDQISGNSESVWIKLQNGGTRDVVIGTCYRSPNALRRRRNAFYVI
jgi:hypothetical protein